MISTLDPLKQAMDSHQLYHQPASSLKHQFHITREQARHIVKNCKSCPLFSTIHSFTVNPRGLRPNDLWQMDVTHVPSFGRLQYVHVVINTFSEFIWAQPLNGENSNQVKKFLFSCFAVMGMPKTIKTDNAPAYSSKSLKHFLSTFKIAHKFGIPYNPTGQAMVKRANQTIKTYINKIKKGECNICFPLQYSYYHTSCLF